MTKKGGENADDVHGEWIRPARFNREGGIRLYVDAWTLREALRAAQIPEDTPVEELEVLRKTMSHGSRGRAQVLIVIRRRAAPEVVVP